MLQQISEEGDFLKTINITVIVIRLFKNALLGTKSHSKWGEFQKDIKLPLFVYVIFRSVFTDL